MDYNSNQHTSTIQITAYLNGEMTDEDAIDLENHISQCDFCNDALEGIEIMKNKRVSIVTKNDLKKKLQKELSSSSEQLSIQIWQLIGITAAILVITTVSVLVLNQKFKNEINTSAFDIFSDKNLDNLKLEQKNSEIAKAEAKDLSEEIEIKQEKVIIKTPIFENQFKINSKIDLPKNEIAVIKELEFEIDKNSKKLDSTIALDNKIADIAPNEHFFENKISQANSEYLFYGTVQDQNKTKLPGVSIRLKGLNIGTISDDNGNFSLKNLTTNQILVFSSIGSKTKEIKISDLNKSLNVILEDDSKSLAEVVVTGKFENELIDLQSIKPVMGWLDLKKYIKQNINFPEEAKQNGISGKVILKMKISDSGRVISYSYLKKLGFGCDEEALRVLREILWEPAIVDGKKTNSSIKLTVKFENNNK